MRKLIVFNNVTLDGYFTGAGSDFSWAHGAGNSEDREFNEFVAGNASGEGELLFGRITYEMMAGYWPTPAAQRDMPAVAEGMNRSRKVVFSRSLAKATWNNTQLVKADIAAAVRRMKSETGPGMVMLGSGSIVAQLAPEGLIDEYQFVVCPVVLGSGRTMFDGVQKRLELRLTTSRTFKNGKVFLSYEPA